MGVLYRSIFSFLEGGREGEVDFCFFGPLVFFCFGFLVFGVGEGGTKTSGCFGDFGGFVFRTNRCVWIFSGGLRIWVHSHLCSRKEQIS